VLALQKQEIDTPRFLLFSLAPGAPPQNVSAEVLNPNSVFLTWSPPPPDQQNGVIRHYLISQYETSTSILTNYTQEGDHTEFIIDSLHAYYEWYALHIVPLFHLYRSQMRSDHFDFDSELIFTDYM